MKLQRFIPLIALLIFVAFLFAAEFVVDGGMETWTSGTDLTSWTESIANSGAITQESTEKTAGSYSCEFYCDNDELASISQVFATVTAGNYYDISFKVKADEVDELGWQLYSSPTSNTYLQDDGTTFGGGNYLRPATTTGWVTWTYSNVRVPTGDTTWQLGFGIGSVWTGYPTTFTCWLDEVSVIDAVSPPADTFVPKVIIIRDEELPKDR